MMTVKSSLVSSAMGNQVGVDQAIYLITILSSLDSWLTLGGSITLAINDRLR